MLVITCQEKENLVIGDNLKVEVVKVSDDRVLLGFTSPDQFPSYWEEELYLNHTEETSEEFDLEPEYVS